MVSLVLPHYTKSFDISLFLLAMVTMTIILGRLLSDIPLVHYATV
jgi:hypothetical protein